MALVPQVLQKLVPEVVLGKQNFKGRFSDLVLANLELVL